MLAPFASSTDEWVARTASGWLAHLAGAIPLDVSTSREFDWDLLHALWRHVGERRDDWITTSPRPKAEHDRSGLQRIVEKGAPRYIGQGFGDAWAQAKQVCQFGPRFQLNADVTLAEVADVMNEMGLLVRELSRIAV